jgi:hypothetical protein
MKLTRRAIIRLSEESIKYPPSMRIAARLVLDGVSIEEYRTMAKTMKIVDSSNLMNIENYLRDIDIKFLVIDKRLEKLANELV